MLLGLVKFVQVYLILTRETKCVFTHWNSGAIIRKNCSLVSSFHTTHVYTDKHLKINLIKLVELMNDIICNSL